MTTAMHDKYKDKGFTVIGFPCNQFMGQEPGTEEEIVAFACERFKADFPIMQKIEVNGKDASPLWEFLKKSKPGLLGTTGIKWNWTCFLINKEGVPVERFSPMVSAKELEPKIQALLEQ